MKKYVNSDQTVMFCVDDVNAVNYKGKSEETDIPLLEDENVSSVPVDLDLLIQTCKEVKKILDVSNKKGVKRVLVSKTSKGILRVEWVRNNDEFVRVLIAPMIGGI